MFKLAIDGRVIQDAARFCSTSKDARYWLQGVNIGDLYT